jgi:hypothetical protein
MIRAGPMSPANLPYYRSFGFVSTGEASLPRGAAVWFMVRDVQ